MSAEVSGQVTPDRVADLENIVQAQAVRLAEQRDKTLNLENVVRDLGNAFLQMVEVHQDTVIQMGRLLDHATNHRDKPSIFCQICTTIETPGGPDEH